jgi:hypothetical protein
MNGWELADEVKRGWPNVCFLLATGWGGGVRTEQLVAQLFQTAKVMAFEADSVEVVEVVDAERAARLPIVKGVIDDDQQAGRPRPPFSPPRWRDWRWNWAWKYVARVLMLPK